MKRSVILVTAISVLIAGIACWRYCAQTRRIVVDTEVHDARHATSFVRLDQVDHSSWDALLAKHVDPSGMVDYASWHESDSDRAELRRYLATLGRVNTKAETTKEAKLAFWINAYNALTAHGILEVYPTSSIRNHTPVLSGYNLWDDLLLPVGVTTYSLNQIEHDVLRKLGEPRIHFAIVCASIGCPRLLNEAYVPEELESQLALNAAHFLSRPSNLHVDRRKREIHVSSILDWFGEDFGPTPRSAVAGLAEYMPDEATRNLVASGDFSVSFLKYDWTLNEQ